MAGEWRTTRHTHAAHTGDAVAVGDHSIANTGNLAIHKHVLPETWEQKLAAAARALARDVGTRGREQLEQRQLTDTEPIEIRFGPAPADLIARLANIRGTPHGAVPEPLKLSGRFSEIAGVYHSCPSQRLVILGERGSGKSVLALKLALELVRPRNDDDPVPVIFGIHSWDPNKKTLPEWMADCLLRDYNLAQVGIPRPDLAAEIVGTGQILPILDGFDEIADGLRDEALRILDKTSIPLVLTSVTDTYATAVRRARTLSRAAVIVLEDLGAEDLTDFLPRTTPADPVTKWEPVLGGLAGTPAGAALSSPLMVGLARRIYSDGPDDPVVLTTGRFPDAEAVKAHLLSRFVTVAYDGPALVRAGERKSRYRCAEKNARRWLGYLARRPADPDIAWWTVADSVPRGQRVPVLLVAGAAVGATAGWLILGLLGLVAGASVLGLLGGVVGWTRASQPVRMEVHFSGRMRHVLAQLGSAILGGLIVVIIGWYLVGWFGWPALTVAGGVGNAIGGGLSGWGRHSDPDADALPGLAEVGRGTWNGLKGGSAGGFVVGILCHLTHVPMGGFGTWLQLGVAIGIAFGLGTAVITPPGEDTVVTPEKLLRSNRNYTIFQTLTVTGAYGYIIGTLTEPAFGLILGPVIGMAFGVAAHAWGRWIILTRCWLPLTGRMPWRLWSFLGDAHGREVLRQSGAVYEFRHALLRDNLAAHHPEH
ncbi:NACHT domain-containing protein [Actinoplanes derwentensis]|uniref:NACHT domain-containing protein n=1 Tax=Actinoplanes derwentensis TaxID=113562 RepID=A0A1H1ZNK5_9ACTN|nr:NACHT domain-containing protein [Actinoplanes derwentensis]GID82533.1 hypothetical protein Ade03nite_14570 [Actinoplanes derwentensis]SDT35233.1 NACHT domain-containing protein [Actinoplanes derwentensis]